MIELREKGRVRIEGKLLLLSGLHIGAGKDSVEIGGIDNPVIRHPFTGEPYIPGSSIKGRLRFLMEWAFDAIRTDGRAWALMTASRSTRTTRCSGSSAMRSRIGRAGRRG